MPSCRQRRLERWLTALIFALEGDVGGTAGAADGGAGEATLEVAAAFAGPASILEEAHEVGAADYADELAFGQDRDAADAAVRQDRDDGFDVGPGGDADHFGAHDVGRDGATTGDDVDVADDADDAVALVEHGQAGDLALAQDARDFFHGHGRRDGDDVRGHDFADLD